MSEAHDASLAFSGLVALHQRLVRDPAMDASGTVLHPRSTSVPQDWRPTFEPIMPYCPVDPADLDLGGGGDFHEIAEERLRRAILDVVTGEGPVHFELLGNRLLAAAEVARMGARIRARMEAALASLEETREIVGIGSFYGRREQFLRPRLRDWGPLPDPERRLEHVADSELMLCLFHAVLDGDGVDADTAMNDGIDRIGFPRLTANARERLQAPLRALLERDMLRREGERLLLGREAFLR